MPTPETTKPLSDRDGNQVLQGAFNDVDKTISTNGFLVGKVGHKVTREDTDAQYLTGLEAGDDYSFYDNSTGGPGLLYTLRLIYTDSTKEVLVSAERVA